MSGSVSLVNGHIDSDKNEMTPQEAIEWLKAIEAKYVHGGDEAFDNKRKTAINTAISALEKLIPKKVTHEASIFKCCTCPHCKNVVDEYTDFEGQKVRVTYDFCRLCGQALDWSDTE